MEAGDSTDVDALQHLDPELSTHITDNEKINAIAGEEVNINSPKQLGEVLDKLQLDPKAKRTAIWPISNQRTDTASLGEPA